MPSDSGQVRRARRHPPCRRSSFRRSERACAGARAQRTAVAWAGVLAPETDLVPLVKADLVARTIPLFPSRRAELQLPTVQLTCRIQSLHGAYRVHSVMTDDWTGSRL